MKKVLKYRKPRPVATALFREANKEVLAHGNRTDIPSKAVLKNTRYEVQMYLCVGCF
jgi:hypothetical protein